MVEGLLQAINDWSQYLANAPHAQIGGWIIAALAVALFLSSFISLRRAPIAASVRLGEGGTAGDDGMHSVGAPNSIVEDAQ